MNWNNEKELTREELYQRVWSAPTTQVAAELGISDVALGKRCKKLNVPKPPPGYWAKVAAGQKPHKEPLPKKPVLVKLKPSSQPRPSPGSIALPENLEELHPVAQKVLKQLRSAKAGWRGIRTAEGSSVFKVSVPEPLIEKAVKSLHVIILALESDGIVIRHPKDRSERAEAFFEKGSDKLYFQIVEKHDYLSSEVSTGKLKFDAQGQHANYHQNIYKRWAENDKRSLEEILFMVVRGMRSYFTDLDQERIRAVESEIRQAEQKRIEQQEARKREHEARLKAIPRQRARDLIKAAEWWRLYTVAMEFIAECERRWRTDAPGDLTPEQQAWLEWAREHAAALSPFEQDYPDPAEDGPFDPSSVPFGGPYLPERDFPHPPTMPKIPPPASPTSFYASHHPQPKPPFPFWLKYPK